MRRAQIDADRVAAAALAAAQRGALYVVVGRRARWLWRLERWAPTTLHRLIGRTYRRQLRDDEGAADDPLPAPAWRSTPENTPCAARPWAD